MVADVVAHRRPAGAAFGHLLHLHDQVVLRVEQVDEQHLEQQRGLGGDFSSCRGGKSVEGALLR